MEVLDGATIFWMTALGLIAGALIKVILGDKGVTLITNLVFGVLGAVICGGIFIVMGMPGSIVMAILGSICILFITNVFYLQPEHAEH